MKIINVSYKFAYFLNFKIKRLPCLIVCLHFTIITISDDIIYSKSYNQTQMYIVTEKLLEYLGTSNRLSINNVIQKVI